MDSIDKWKTSFPFFVNPPKSVVEGGSMVVTKLTAAMVFGCGVKAGVYCFYANEQVVHETNLTAVEVLQWTLLKPEDSGPRT